MLPGCCAATAPGTFAGSSSPCPNQASLAAVVRALEDALVGRDLIQDLLAKRRLIPFANALQVAERSVQTHATVDHPGASLSKCHQVDLVVPALGFPGQRPARRARVVTDRSLAA